ncbi:unnamed protein product, partial [Prorocentrum cordatum]
RKAAVKELMDNVEGLRNDMAQKHSAAKSSESMRSAGHSSTAADTGKGGNSIRIIDYPFNVTEQVPAAVDMGARFVHDADLNWAVPFMLRAGREFIDGLRGDALLGEARPQLHVDEGKNLGAKLTGAIRALGKPKDYVPALDEASVNLLDSPADQKKWMMQPSVSGIGSKSYYACSEFLSMGCLRLQFDGARRVAIVPYDKLRAMCLEYQGIPPGSNNIKYDS